MKSWTEDNLSIVDTECPHCNGTGASEQDVGPVHVCYHCNGGGYLKQWKEIKNTIRKLPKSRVIKHETSKFS